MQKFLSVIVWIVSFILSRQYAAGYWIVGPVFAAAVFLVNGQKVFKKFGWPHALYFAASTVIYALVYRLADKGWKFSPDILDMLAGGFTAGVIIGSVLLPSVHMLLFGNSFKEVRVVILWLVMMWYIVLGAAWAYEALQLRGAIDFMLIAIALWQGIYLKKMKV